MRTLISLILLASCCFGCGGAGQDAENIDTLAKDWDKATMEVTSAVNHLAEAQEAVNETLNELMKAEERGSLPAEEQQALRESLEAHSESLSVQAEQAFEFVNQWQEGAERLDKLKTAESPSDTNSQLRALKDMIRTGRAKAEAWNQTAEEAEATTASAQELVN